VWRFFIPKAFFFFLSDLCGCVPLFPGFWEGLRGRVIYKCHVAGYYLYALFLQCRTRMWDTAVQGLVRRRAAVSWVWGDMHMHDEEEGRDEPLWLIFGCSLSLFFVDGARKRFRQLQTDSCNPRVVSRSGCQGLSGLFRCLLEAPVITSLSGRRRWLEV
jgi:hypothetical protein